MSAFTDIVKTALNQYEGRIPSTIPAHYVKWAYFQHRASKKLSTPKTNVIKYSVIHL